MISDSYCTRYAARYRYRGVNVHGRTATHLDLDIFHLELLGIAGYRSTEID